MNPSPLFKISAFRTFLAYLSKYILRSGPKICEKNHQKSLLLNSGNSFMRTTAFICLFFLFCFPCCSKKPIKEKAVRLAFLSEANSLDPRFGYEIPANHVVKMLFEGLMRVASDGSITEAAAESCTISEDQKTYQFKLREAYWSNGMKVTAHDFEYAWKSVIDPTLPTQGCSDFYPIKNVKAIIKGELPVHEAGVTALDDRTLVVELEHPTPYFLELTATSAFSPIFAALAKQNEDVSMVSNGPFVLKERLLHDRMALEKNPLYWNKEQVAIERIEVSIVEDASTQLALFEKNEIDWFGKPFAKLPLDAVPALKEKDILQTFPERAVYWYFLNTEKFPFTCQKIRKAFALAIDRHAIVSHVLKENELPATSVNSGLSFFQDGDVAQARRLFEEALHELDLTRDIFPKVKLSYCGIETNHRIAAVVQQQWQQAFGIEVVLDPQEWTTYYDNLTSGNFLAGGLSWHARIRDPIYNLQLFACKEDRLNISNWEHPVFQELIEDAIEEPDLTIRSDYLKLAEAFLMEEMPVIPIYFLSMSYAKNPLLENVYLSEINEIDFSRARINR